MLTTMSIIDLDQGKIWQAPRPPLQEDPSAAPHRATVADAGRRSPSTLLASVCSPVFGAARALRSLAAASLGRLEVPGAKAVDLD